MILIKNSLSRTLHTFLLTACAAITASTLAAESSVTLDNFDQIVEGRTLGFFADNDGVHKFIGVERYLPNQHVVWLTESGLCLEGSWVVREGAICFNYGGPDYCWRLDREVPESEAVFSYRLDGTRQIAFPTDITVPASCAPLLSSTLQPQSGLTVSG